MKFPRHCILGLMEMVEVGMVVVHVEVAASVEVVVDEVVVVMLESVVVVEVVEVVG